MSFDDLKEYSEKVRNQEKKVTLEYEADGEEHEETFTIRMLTQDEKDRLAEFSEVKMSDDGEIEEMKANTNKAHVYLIRTGLVDEPDKQPEGFKATRENILSLLPDMREYLANQIKNFSKIDEETRKSFR